MTAREFCYWLQGFFEITEAKMLSGLPPAAIGPNTSAGFSMSAAEVDVVRKHLSLVFTHEIDPSYPNQEKLNQIHNEKVTKPELMARPRC